jgi:hypothetical protein
MVKILAIAFTVGVVAAVAAAVVQRLIFGQPQFGFTVGAALLGFLATFLPQALDRTSAGRRREK